MLMLRVGPRGGVNEMPTTAVAQKPRLTNPALLVPEAMAPLQALGQTLGQLKGKAGRALSLAMMRATQLNGCAMCLNWQGAKAEGESDERLFAVSVWRESTLFTPPERAAMALAEAMTRLSDRYDPVPDAIWDEAAHHFNERELAYLVLGISTINLYNRINVTTRQVQQHWDESAAKEWAAKNKM
jgi:AhpD family alkylhydroperoxidase